MALAIADRVKETTTSTGTGTINLAGAVTGFQTFVAGIGDGNTCYYAIEDANGSAWEVGIGTVTDASPDTLARTTVLKSTNSNNALTLTSGTHTVFATYPSDKAVFKDESGIVLASGIQVGASGLLLDSVTITTLQAASESFADNDTSLMTSASIQDKIEDYGYTTNTGDITAVVAGSGISGGADTGSATVTLDLNGLASGVVADNDYLVFVDVNDSNSGKKESLGDIAGLFAGTNLTATNSVIAVDDAFLKNDANDTTTGTVTAAGFTTTGLTTASGVKVQRDSASGVIINSQIAFGDYTFILPSGNGTDGQVLTTDSKNTYWSSAGDITAVVAGSGMSGGATSGSATVTLDLNGLASGVVADNDYLVFVDVNDSNSGKKESLGDIAALFAGTNLTAANSVISVDDAFLKNNADDTTTGTITAGGFTTTGTWTMDTSAGGTAGITNINVGSAFTDDDVTLMSAGAIKDKIESYNYGDITAVVAGSGMSGGDTSGSATVNLDLNGLASGVIANDDYIVFVDSGDGTSKKDNLPDLATLFAGTNLTATNSVIAVDDAFLKNDANDTTTGTVTAAGFTTTGLATASGVKVQRESASGVTINSQLAFNDYTFMLPSGNGTDGQVLTTDSKNTYWSTASGGVSGDTFATDLKIGRDSDNLIDFATTDNKIILRANGNDEVELVENALSPVANDGVALGTGSLMWSDLFIADGGVVNFNNGDATLTHESNKIVASGCEIVVNRPGRSQATFRRTTDGDASIEVDASFHDADNDAQLRMLSGTSGDCSIFFGDTADNNIGLITYAHSTDAFTIKTNATAAIVIDSNGTLQTKGIIREVATKVHANYTVTASDHIILVDTDSTNRTITLPSAAAANIGQEYTIKKIDDGTGLVNIVPASTGGYGPDDIDEYDTAYILYAQHDTVTFVCGPGDASATDEQWWVIAEKVQPHSAQLEQRTAQTIPQRSTANTVVTMTHVRHEVGCDADTSTNRIDIKRKGRYAVTAHCVLDDQHAHWGVKTRILHYDDSATSSSYHGETKAVSYVDDGRDIGATTTAILELDVDDYVQAIIWNSYPGTRDTRVSGVEDYSYIAVQEIK